MPDKKPDDLGTTARYLFAATCVAMAGALFVKAAKNEPADASTKAAAAPVPAPAASAGPR